MSPRSRDRPVLVWLELIALTLGSVIVAEAAGVRMAVLAIIFGVAIIKGQLIAVHFMETPKSTAAWNGLYRVWILFIGLALMLGTALAPAGPSGAGQLPRGHAVHVAVVAAVGHDTRAVRPRTFDLGPGEER